MPPMLSKLLVSEPRSLSRRTRLLLPPVWLLAEGGGVAVSLLALDGGVSR